MPWYDYQCEKCFHVIEVQHGYHDEGPQECANCESKIPLTKLISVPTIIDGTPKSLGALAEKNSDKLSNDEKHHIENKNTRKFKPDGITLPRVKRSEQIIPPWRQDKKVKRFKDPKKYIQEGKDG